MLVLANWAVFVLAAFLFLYQLRLAHPGVAQRAVLNQKRSHPNEKEVIVAVESPGSESAVPARAGTLHDRMGRWLLAFMGCGVALLPAAELVRLSHGWPLNPQCTPKVAGPGDSIIAYTGEVIDSMDGLWNGQVTARIVNAQEAGLPQQQLPASTKQRSWGNELSYHPSCLWVRLEMPDDPSFANKSVEVQIDGQIVFPKRAEGFFINTRQNISHRMTLKTTTAHAGQVYSLAWYGGNIVGLLLMFSATLMLLLFSGKGKSGATKSVLVPLPIDHESPPGLFTSPTGKKASEKRDTWLFVFYWVWVGGGFARVPIGEYGTRACPACRQDCAFTLILEYCYIHLYFIFGMVTRRKFLEVCKCCGNAWPVPRGEIPSMRLVERKLVPFMRRWGLLILLLLIIAGLGALIGLLFLVVHGHAPPL